MYSFVLDKIRAYFCDKYLLPVASEAMIETGRSKSGYNLVPAISNYTKFTTKS